MKAKKFKYIANSKNPLLLIYWVNFYKTQSIPPFRTFKLLQKKVFTNFHKCCKTRPPQDIILTELTLRSFCRSCLKLSPYIYDAELRV